jgi:hemoglobin-like flavoprotein
MSLTLLAPPPELFDATDTALTLEQKRLIRESFARIEPASDLVARLFYLKSIDLDPSLREVFKAPSRAERRKFMGALKIAIISLDRLQALQPILKLLGTRQRLDGIKSNHYATFRRAWVWTMEQSLDARFTHDARAAWTSLLNQMTSATA